MFEIFTDGSCDNLTKAVGGWGFILIDRISKQLRIVNGQVFKTTSNRMEITAAIEGLRFISDLSHVHIFSDSAYLVNTVNENWKKKKNCDLWDILFLEIKRVKNVKFSWIKSHNGHKYNEMADSLANRGARGCLEHSILNLNDYNHFNSI